MAPTQLSNLPELLKRLADCGERFVDAVDELAPIAGELAQLEAKVRVARQLASRFERLPLSRELGAEVVFGRLSALRPYVTFVTAESANRAAEALTAPK